MALGIRIFPNFRASERGIRIASEHMNLRLQPGKAEYTEEEAALALGVSASQFRSLLLRHVLEEAESLDNVAVMRFRPSDLLMLSMLHRTPVSS